MPEAMVCIFAKPPEPGAVKTRLIPELGPDRAAELAEAFLEDTVAMVRTLTWAECIIAATRTFERSYFKPEEVWLQSEGDLGDRLEKVLRLALKREPIVLAIGADSPGLPAAYLESARQALKTADAVLGPSADGGFYLIGLKDCPVGVLEGIQWSHSTTLAATVHKLEQFGLKTVLINPWFDVDGHEDLERLRRQLANDPSAAPRTAELLRQASSEK
ncbi:MAG: TIGR04282 family arsenosugar biosynthesis glycosyltransferase [Candidatus Angelobacter sp.]